MFYERRLSLRWLKDVENDLRGLQVNSWRITLHRRMCICHKRSQISYGTVDVFNRWRGLAWLSRTHVFSFRGLRWLVLPQNSETTNLSGTTHIWYGSLGDRSAHCKVITRTIQGRKTWACVHTSSGICTCDRCLPALQNSKHTISIN
jgi:hypothetical protein